MPSGKLVDDRKGRTPSGESSKTELLLVAGNADRPFSLSWSQYVFLVSINDPNERRFYEIEASAMRIRQSRFLFLDLHKR